MESCPLLCTFMSSLLTRNLIRKEALAVVSMSIPICAFFRTHKTGKVGDLRSSCMVLLESQISREPSVSN